MARMPPERKIMLLCRFPRQCRETFGWEQVLLVSGANWSAKCCSMQDLIRAARLLHAADFVPDLVAESFLQKQAANDEGHGGYGHRIVQPSQDIARGCTGRQPNQRHHAPEHTVANVIREGKRRIANLCRERLDKIGSYRTVDHANVNDLDEYQQHEHRYVGIRRFLRGYERARGIAAKGCESNGARDLVLRGLDGF